MTSCLQVTYLPAEYLDDSHLLGGVARETAETNDVMFAGDVPAEDLDDSHLLGGVARPK